MSFSIKKKDMFEIIQKAYPVAPVKSSLQILSNIKLSCKDGILEAVATDLDYSIRAFGSVSSEDMFEIAVNARKSFDIVREIQDGDITCNVDENVLCLNSDKGFFKIAGADVSDYPEFPEVTDGIDFEISVKDLKNMVIKSSFAVSKDTSRSCLCGVLWEVENDKSTMVATDGHRLGCSVVKGNFKLSEKVSSIISQKTLLHVVRILDTGNKYENIKITAGEKYILFKAEDFSICSKLIDGPYPDYKKVIPKDNPKSVKIEKKLLVDAVKRVSVLSNQKTHLVKFSFSENMLEVAVLNRDIGGEAKESIPVKYEGEDHTIGLNAQFLLEILNIVNVPEIKIEMNSQISACLIFPRGEKEKSSEDLFLIMPLRIMEEV